MKWLCSVGIVVSLALRPALADGLFGNYPLTPGARDTSVTELPKKMIVDEKIGQLRLIGVGPDSPEEVIRKMIKDGQVGVIFNTVTRQDIRAIQDQVMELSRLKTPLFLVHDVLHGQRTVFLISLGLASSFNPDAVKTVGRVSAHEAVDDGLNTTWTPMVDVSRDPRQRHVSEGFSGDTYLILTMGKTIVEAIQSKSPADRYSVVISIKRSAAYGTVEGGKEYNTVDMSPQRLFSDYMPSYKAGLDAGSSAVMVVLNSLNGAPVTSDSQPLRDILRDQWGFKDIAVSDHGVIRGLIKHGTAAGPENTVHVTLKFGINMNMSDECYSKYPSRLTKSGKVTMEELDDAARHVLNAKYDAGLFNGPCSRLRPKESNSVGINAESRLHCKEAHETARGSLVLLKNRLETLSLKKSVTIAVAGPLADSKRGVIGG